MYAHFGDKAMRLGIISARRSDESLEAMVPGKIDRLSINDHQDLLAEVKQ